MVNKIILGTVQFGINYGINNTSGKISFDNVCKILNYSNLNGITQLDTAAAYGDAEHVIGEFLKKNIGKEFKIISKLYLKNQTLENSLLSSINKLNIKMLETILFHSYEDYQTHKNEMINFNNKYKGKLFNNIGVSAYTNNEVVDIINDEFVDIIQMPFNILDNASKREETYKKIKEKGKILHTRSVFLQGLIFKKSFELKDEFKILHDAFLKIEKLCNDYDLTINELALSYVLSKDYIDGVLIGVDSLEHLKKNISISELRISQNLIEEIDNLVIQNDSILNPTNWVKK
jgi:aryl-alcohol dehydrogenase-like predicted oxidoreductase